MNHAQEKTLLHIINCKSITQAARELYMSPVSLWEKINRIEDELGFKIFSRSHKGIELTTAGKTFCDYLKSAVPAYEAVLDQCRVLEKNAYTIRVSVYASLETLPILYAYQKKNPAIQFDFIKMENDVSKILDWYENEKLDILQTQLPINIPENYVCMPLAQYQFCCAMSTHHPLSEKKEIRLSDLRPYLVRIFRPFPSPVQRYIPLFDEHGISYTDEQYDQKRIMHNALTSNCIYIIDSQADYLFKPLRILPLIPDLKFYHGLVYKTDAPAPIKSCISYIEEVAGKSHIEMLKKSLEIEKM